MKFKADFTPPCFDLAGYRALLKAEMSDAIAQAVMHWLEAVLGEIPVWSGASRATFRKIAEEIGVTVPIDHNTVTSREGIGEAMSEGKVHIDEPANHYTFTYGTDLPWLVWNEYHNANDEPDATKWKPPAKLKRPGPYEFQAKGYQAVLQFSKGVYLPDPAPFVKGGSRIKV